MKLWAVPPRFQHFVVHTTFTQSAKRSFRRHPICRPILRLLATIVTFVHPQYLARNRQFVGYILPSSGSSGGILSLGFRESRVLYEEFEGVWFVGFVPSFVRCAAMASDGSVAEGSKLKSAQLLEMVRTHLTTDAGKELQKKIGFVYQINIAPKVCIQIFGVISGLFDLGSGVYASRRSEICFRDYLSLSVVVPPMVG